MAYIGFNPSQQAVAAFATKLFTGDGTTTTFTLDQSVPGANEANVEVVVENVLQNPIDAYTIGGSLNNQLIFSEAPVSGAAIYVIHKGEATYNLQPSTGSVTSATLDPVLRNFTVNTFTGTGSATQFTLTDTPYSPNSILVMVDGIVQTAGVNYNVSGTTLDFGATAPDNGSNITVVHLGFSSGNKAVMDASITPVKLSTGHPTWDTSSALYIGSAAALGGATNPIVAMSSSANNYVQSYILNRSNGTGASADLVAYPDNGTDASGWIDMGITSSTFSSSTYGITGANEGYLFMSAPSGASKTGNLVIATDSTGTSNAIVLATGGFTAGTERARITSGGNMGLGTSTWINGIGVNSNSRILTIAGNGTTVGARGAIELQNPISLANITSSTGIGSFYFSLPGYNSINSGYSQHMVLQDVFTSGSGGANGYGATLHFYTKADNSTSVPRRMSIDHNGVIDLPYGQIKFPATQNASSDPNTLDDYEEGSFPPGPWSQGGTITSTTSYGSYVKVGNVVTARGSVALTNVGTASGVLNISLPFTASNVLTSTSGQQMGISREAGQTGNAFYNVSIPGSTTLQINSSTNGPITWTNGYVYNFSITYIAA